MRLTISFSFSLDEDWYLKSEEIEHSLAEAAKFSLTVPEALLATLFAELVSMMSAERSESVSEDESSFESELPSLTTVHDPLTILSCMVLILRAASRSESAARLGVLLEAGWRGCRSEA